MPSQSPINGSTKQSTNTRAIRAGRSHHGHARQNDAGADAVEACRGAATVALSELSMDVFVVRGAWFNKLSFGRTFRPLNHFYAITLRIVLNFVHDVVDKQDASA